MEYLLQVSLEITVMKIPAVLMASLLAVGVAGQTSKPVSKNIKKPVKKVRKAEVTKNSEKAPPKIVKRDTLPRLNAHYCPACGMG